MKKRLEPNKSARLLNPGAVALVSAAHKGRDNLFAVTWNMPVRKDPGMVAILSGKRHFTYPLIADSGEMALNLPTENLREAVFGCGSVSGHKEEDKWTRFGLTREEGRVIGAPLVREAVARLECRICQVVDLGKSALLLAQIVAADIEEEHYNEKDGGYTYASGLKLLHHLGGNRFSVSEREI